MVEVVVGGGAEVKKGSCVYMGTGDQRRKERKTQEHVKQEQLNMRQERKVKHLTLSTFR